MRRARLAVVLGVSLRLDLLEASREAMVLVMPIRVMMSRRADESEQRQRRVEGHERVHGGQQTRAAAAGR